MQSLDEEQSDWRRYQATRDTALRERLILAQMPWLVEMARSYNPWRRTVEDLANDGLIGVLQYMDKFDPNYTPYRRFRTAAAPYARHEMVTSLKADISDAPTMPWPIVAPSWMLDGDGDEWQTDSFSSIPDQKPGPEEQLMTAMDGEEISYAVREALCSLTENERFVIERRFGLVADGVSLKQAEIGALLHVTQQRVSALQNSAIKRMRNALTNLGDGELVAHQFAEFIDIATKRRVVSRTTTAA